MAGPLVPYSDEEIEAFELQELGVADGSSGVINFEIDHNYGTRMYRCAWEWRYDVAAYLLGYSALYVDGSGNTKLSRLMPVPFDDSLPNVIAAQISDMKGMQWVGRDNNGDTQTNVFTWALFTVRYWNPPYELAADGDITSELDRYWQFPAKTRTSGDVLQLPGNTLFYRTPTGAGNANGKPTQVGAPVTCPTETVFGVWNRLPDAAFDITSNLYIRLYQGTFTAGVSDGYPYLGTINRATFQGRPPGTLLLNGSNPVWQRSPSTDDYEWTLEYEFIYKPQGWNFLFYFDAAAGSPGSGWWFVSRQGLGYFAPGSVPDGASLYVEREFANLVSVS